MKTTIKLQATGYSPVGYVVLGHCFESIQMLEGDKRGVRLRLWTTTGGTFVAELTYLTSWGTEREFTWVDVRNDLVKTADWVRARGAAILPPGAGFPATPQYETRQSKLGGMMETLTLVALSDVLAQADEEGWV